LAATQQQEEARKYNLHAAESNYLQHSPYDFELKDRPTIMPHDSFAKYYFPDYFTRPGADWELAAP
jgi:hypothetical protein